MANLSLHKVGVAYRSSLLVPSSQLDLVTMELCNPGSRSNVTGAFYDDSLDQLGIHITRRRFPEEYESSLGFVEL